MDEETTLLVFEGEGHGLMGGVTRYVVFTSTPDDGEREPAPGFHLEAEYTFPMLIDALGQIESDVLVRHS